MKKTVQITIRLLSVSLLAVHSVMAQGSITYVSNLGQTPSGSVSVGANAWYAGDFVSGTNAGGYLLDTVQLEMTDASGDPNSFTVMIYTGPDILGGNRPGSSLGTLLGSANPTAAGVYTYTSSSSLQLLANTVYFVVITAGTQTSGGVYSWSATSDPSTGYTAYHWGGTTFAESTDGLNWNYVPSGFGQFALNATATPEPGVVGLLALGVSLFGLRRWNEKKKHPN
jgi:hypothetical protein